jgi:hypothetical protein
MAHHKRQGPKSTRAGCLLCKPQKRQGTPLKERRRFSQWRKMKVTEEKISEATCR